MKTSVKMEIVIYPYDTELYPQGATSFDGVARFRIQYIMPEFGAYIRDNILL